MMINAKYASECPVCNNAIRIGERVEWVRRSAARHAACAGSSSSTRSARRAPAAKNGSCAKCGTPCSARYATCYGCSKGWTPRATAPAVEADASDTIQDMPAIDPEREAALAAIPF